MLDTEILAKIIEGDLVAIEAKYHISCLVQCETAQDDTKNVRSKC